MSGKILFILLAIPSLFLSQTSPVVFAASASAVPYGLVSDQTAPVAAVADDLVVGDEEFLMESEISRRILISYSGVTTGTQNQGHPSVACGQPGYRACLPGQNGKTPRVCGTYQRDCH